MGGACQADTKVNTVMVFGRFCQITSQEKVHGLWDTAAAVGKDHLGFGKEDIGTHLLRSSGNVNVLRPVSGLYNYDDWEVVQLRIPPVHQKTSWAIQPQCGKQDAHIWNNPTILRVDPRIRNHADNAATHRNIGGDMAAQARLIAFALDYWKTGYNDGGAFWFLLGFGRGAQY